MSFEGIKNKTRELGEVLKNKYLLMCLVALASISKDKNTSPNQDQSQDYNRVNQKSLEGFEIYDAGFPSTNSTNNELEETDTLSTSNKRPMKENSENIDSTNSTSANTPKLDKISTAEGIAGVKKPVKDLSLSEFSLEESGEPVETEPVARFTDNVRKFLDKYNSKEDKSAGILDMSFRGKIIARKLSEQLEVKQKMLETELSNFGKNIYKKEYATKYEKIFDYIFHEQSIYDIHPNQADEFIFLTCFLHYLHKNNKLESWMNVPTSLGKHKTEYKNTKGDPDLEEISFFIHFFYKSWSKMEGNPNVINIPDKITGSEEEFRQLLLKNIPLNDILEIARKYNK